MPLAVFNPAAVIAVAEDTEVGLCINFNDNTDLEDIRTKLYTAGAGDNFQVSIMDNPKELWLLKKGVELDG